MGYDLFYVIVCQLFHNGCRNNLPVTTVGELQTGSICLSCVKNRFNDVYHHSVTSWEGVAVEGIALARLVFYTVP